MYLSKCFDNFDKNNLDIYDKLLLVENSIAEDLINKDLNRTILISTNISIKEKLEKKKLHLFNILKVYANYDPKVLFVQGTSFIVLALLSVFNSEKAAFWCYISIMDKYNWRELYTDGLPRLHRLLQLLTNSIIKKCNNIYNTFFSGDNSVLISAIFQSYFLCLFSYNIDLEYTLRVIDYFWIYQEKTIIDCIIHLLCLNEELILNMNNEKIFTFLKSEIVNYSIKTYGIDKCLPYK